MCGIFGYTDQNTIGAARQKELEQALNTLYHRGPDGGSIFVHDNVLLGHRRLSIIDLSEHAGQPFRSACGNYVIVFNGEIYNYKELSAGLTLRTSSDTEVLLEGYIKHGASFFSSIRGIYAFAIYDLARREIIMLRDPAGIKPFYLRRDAHSLAFASEIKALTACGGERLTLNKDAIKLYLHVGYIPEPQTVYNEISALTPGVLHTLNISTRQITQQPVLEFDFGTVNKLSAEENINRTSALLKTAARRNLVADVDINIALSGGIDSSLIFAYANEVRPTRGLTVRQHEEEFDESEVATAYASHLKAPHQIVSTQVDNKIDLLNRLLLHFDQPYADSSFIPTYFLCKAAAGYSKVLIGGDSGDEIHNGYSGYRVLPIAIRINRNGLLRTLASWTLRAVQPFVAKGRKRELQKLITLVEARDINELLFNWHSWQPASPDSYARNPFRYDTGNIYKLFTSFDKEIPAHEAITNYYFNKRMVSDYLRKSEMMAMYNSLEFRVPMLDEDLVQFSLSIPYAQKSKDSIQKIILRTLHSKVYPPDTSKLRKKGFSIPLDTWLGDENLRIIKETLKRSDGILHEYIDPGYVDTLFETLTNPALHQYCSREGAYERILILYSLQLWYLNTYKASAA